MAFVSTIQVPFCEEKSVQLVRVAFFQSDFLQNAYFFLTIYVGAKSLTKQEGPNVCWDA